MSGLGAVAMLLALLNLGLGLALVDISMQADRGRERERQWRTQVDKALEAAQLWKRNAGEFERANTTNEATLKRCMDTLTSMGL